MKLIWSWSECNVRAPFKVYSCCITVPKKLTNPYFPNAKVLYGGLGAKGVSNPTKVERYLRALQMQLPKTPNLFREYPHES